MHCQQLQRKIPNLQRPNKRPNKRMQVSHNRRTSRFPRLFRHKIHLSERGSPAKQFRFFFLFAFLALGCPVSLCADDSFYGGQLIEATTSDPKSFNSIIAKETSTTSVTNLIFEGLTRTNGVTTKVEPNLAERW